MDYVDDVVRSFGRTWWQMAIGGVLLIILAMFLFFWPVKIASLVIIAGALYFVIDGVMDTFGALTNRKHPGWLWNLIEGVIGIVVGGVLLLTPISGSFLALFVQFFALGFAAIARGIVRIIGGIQTARSVEYRWSWSTFFMGLTEIIIGFFLMVFQILGVLTITWLIATVALIGGIVTIYQSLKVRKLKHQPPPMMTAQMR